jgi:hypothetical protein
VSRASHITVTVNAPTTNSANSAGSRQKSGSGVCSA